MDQFIVLRELLTMKLIQNINTLMLKEVTAGRKGDSTQEV